MGHVFISYSSRHRHLTEVLAERLEAEGYPVWWDHALEAWGEYEPQIRQAIEEAAVFVVIWSAAAAASSFVKAEVEKALRLGRLVNLRAPDFPLDEVPLNYAAVDHILPLDFDHFGPILKTLETVWQGRVPQGLKPLHLSHRDLYGVDLFDPKRRALPEDAAQVTPSVLLQASFEVVDYVDATGHLDDMLDWCRGSGAHSETARPSAGRLIHGPGGLGKTRLMIETVRRLRGEGWLAGFQPAPGPGDEAQRKHRAQALEQVVMAEGPEPGVLMVLDYAEARGADVIDLARFISRRPREDFRPLRLVLLSRGETWWHDLYRAEPEIQVLFNKRGARHGDVLAVEPLPEGERRLALFDAMRAALKPRLDQQAEAGLFPVPTLAPLPEARRERLSRDPAHARPLALQMEALLSLAGEGGEEIADLLESVLALERRHWRRVDATLAEGSDREAAMRRGLGQVTAVGGVGTRRDATRLLSADAHFGTRAPADLPLRDLVRLYAAGRDGIAALEPDLIGEHEILMSGDEDMVDACRAWIDAQPEGDRSARRRVLFTVLQRAARAEHGPRVAEAEALLAHVVGSLAESEAQDLVAVAIETSGPLSGLLKASISVTSAQVLQSLLDAIPGSSVRLLEVSVDIARRLVQQMRQDRRLSVQTMNTLKYLNNCVLLTELLSRSGRFEEAVGLAKQALDEIASSPDGSSEYYIDVKIALLTNVAAPLGEMGQVEAAIDALNSAGETLSDDLGIQTKEQTSKLIKILSNTAMWQYRSGNPSGAVDSAAKAISAIKESAFAHDYVSRVTEAQVLNNFGAFLMECGRLDEATKALDEALVMRRIQAEQFPDQNLALVAQTLEALGLCWQKRGNFGLSIECSNEAIMILRKLNKDGAGVLASRLAAALTNSTQALLDAQEFRAALEVASEAVSIRREQVGFGEDALKPWLAIALFNYASVLLKADRHNEAIAALSEAMEILRLVAPSNPKYFESLIANCVDAISTVKNEMAGLGKKIGATDESS